VERLRRDAESEVDRRLVVAINEPLNETHPGEDDLE
jgi:hypothetical protein